MASSAVAQRRRRGRLRLVGILLFGGISIGENQAGRFPTAPRTAAGGAANAADVVAAAEWLRADAGESHLVATDVGTAVPFATEGRQQILSWASWYPFVVGDPSEIAAFVRETDTEYLVSTAVSPRCRHATAHISAHRRYRTTSSPAHRSRPTSSGRSMPFPSSAACTPGQIS